MPARRRKRRRDKGTGSIFQLPDGRWRSEVAWTLPDGRLKKSTFTRRRKEDVIKEHNLRVGQIEAGTYGKRSDSGTLEALMQEWLEKEVRQHRSADTFRSYKYLYEMHVRPRLGKMKLVDITKKQVRELLDDKLKSGLSSNTVQRIQATIRSAYNHAIADGELEANPATGLKVRKSKKREVKFLQPDQARAILGACKTAAVGPPLLMALGTGMRLGEVLGLRWQDIDRKQGVIRLHVQLKRGTGGFFHAPLKTESSRRTLQISPTIADALDRAEKLKDMADSQAKKLDLVFLSPTGGPVHQKWFNDELKAICKSLVIEPISAHGLRHTAASLLIANSVDIALVQQQLGHSTILLTANTYGHLVPAGMKRTSGVLDRTLRTGKVGKG